MTFDANIGGPKTNKLGSTVTIKGTAPVPADDASEADKNYDGNNVLTSIEQDGNGNTTVTVKLNKDLTSKSVTTNKVVVQGTPGADGKDAEIVVGEKGEPGTPGKPGKDGSDGKIGVNGKDGSAVVINGKDGSIGATGKDGTSVVINGKDGTIGLTGPKGADGTPGTPGKSINIGVKPGYDTTHDDGTPNVQGKNGVDGADGKDGITRIVYTTTVKDPDTNTDKTVEHQVATMDDGMKYAGDDYVAAVGTTAEQNVIVKKLNNRLDIIGGATGTLTNNNIGVNKTNDGKLKVQLASDLTGINSITNGANSGSVLS